MGFDDGPDSLALGVVQVLRGEAQACGMLLLAANPFSELVVGFHCSGLTMSPVAVQQTGRLMAAFCSEATRSPEPDRHQRTAPSCALPWDLRPSLHEAGPVEITTNRSDRAFRSMGDHLFEEAGSDGFAAAFG
jgi:hypothetical protein